MGLVTKHDPIVEERLFHGLRNGKYTSHMIQNNILVVMASLVRKQICHSVQKACFYSLMVDETKDLSKHEQMSVVVRYVDGETEPALIRERFLTFIPAATLSTESLTKYILEALTRYDLNPQLMVSQGYDGASVMSGHCSGVQQQVREVAPYAVYVHCHAHVLNLVLVDCVKRNSCASEFFPCFRYCMYSYPRAKLMLSLLRTRRSFTLVNQRWSLSVCQTHGGPVDP